MSEGQKVLFNFTVETTDQEKARVISRIANLVTAAGYKVFNIEQIEDEPNT